MPIRFTVDPTAAVVVATVDPPMPTGAELETFLDAVLSNPAYRQGMGILYDRRRVPPPDRVYMEAVAAAITARCDQMAPCKWAVVVGDLGTMGMVWYGATQYPDVGVDGRPFSDCEEAFAWLRGEV